MRLWSSSLSRFIFFMLITCAILFCVMTPAALADETEGSDSSETTIEQAPSLEPSENYLGEVGGYLIGEYSVARSAFYDRRFTEPNGHGFAAEEANNFIDRLHGLDANVVGYDNMANGPDRRIVNRDGSFILIQDKYHSSAKGSVDDAFDSDTGLYRYITSDGSPMQLEVSYDQYDDAVLLMRDKIEEGRVPGVYDPAEAENLVRRGRLTYEQAVNLTKAGNLTSLKYDAMHGVITAAGAWGISFAIDFALCMVDGMPVSEALGESAKYATLTGSAVFAAEVLTRQLMRTSLSGAMSPTVEGVTRWLGKEACRTILRNAGIDVAGLTTSQLARYAARILQSGVIFNTLFTVALTVPDALDLLHGRISQEQFLKNLSVIVVGMIGASAGSAAGGAVGTYLAPGIGTKAGVVLGALVGGAAGTTLANVVGNQFVKDDAEYMYDIISDRFSTYCTAYVVSAEEADEIAQEIRNQLDEGKLKDMFASEDREAYADEFIEPLFEEVAANRTFEEPPSDYEIRSAMLEDLQGVVFVH